MDLQVRSQDKETLTKIFDGIYYYYDEETVRKVRKLMSVYEMPKEYL